MNYTRDEFIEALKLPRVPDMLFDSFESDMAEFDKSDLAFIQDAYIDMLQQKYAPFTDTLKFVYESAKAVRESELASRYAFILMRALERCKEGEYIRLPDSGLSDIAVEMAPFFALLAYLPKTADMLIESDMPRDIMYDQLIRCFESAIKLSAETLGRNGFNASSYFSWDQRYLRCKLFRVGIYNFEIRDKFFDYVTVLRNKDGKTVVLANGIDVSESGFMSGSAGHEDIAFRAELQSDGDAFIGHMIDGKTCKIEREKSKFSKSEWSIAIGENDSVINVHIPKNANITPATSDGSYRECLDIIKRYFPTFEPKAFICCSWMLEPRLDMFLKPESRILYFQSKYTKFPRVDNGNAVFKFVFNKPTGSDPRPYENLPEDTSLRRMLKQHYISGGYMYAQCGVFFFDEIGD